MDAVPIRETFPDRVVYTLSIPHATPEDSGTYECSITHMMSGKSRVSDVAVTVFGKTLSAPECPLDAFINMSVLQNCNKVTKCLHR